MNNHDPAPTFGMTLYKEVKRQVLDALAAGEWQPGEAIPSERRLCERFGVSIGTLRKAIDELEAENILIRHQGRGTFVATHGRDQHWFRFFNVVRQDGAKTYPVPRLVSFAHGRPDRLVCRELNLAGRANVFRFINVLSLHDMPVLVDEIVLPEALFAGLTEAQLRDRPSTLYSFYQKRFGLNVIRIEERVRSSLATARHASLLGIKAGAPLLEVHRVAFSYNNLRVERRVSHVNTDLYEYWVDAAQ